MEEARKELADLYSEVETVIARDSKRDRAWQSIDMHRQEVVRISVQAIFRSLKFSQSVDPKMPRWRTTLSATDKTDSCLSEDG